MDSKDILALVAQLKRIGDALEENNALRKKELVIEKKKYRHDYMNEIHPSQDIDFNNPSTNFNGEEEKV